MCKIGVLGAGTWGMALARNLSNSGHTVTVWSKLPQEIDDLSATYTQKNLPGMIIPRGIIFTKDIKDACLCADIILFAVPSVFVRSTTALAVDFISKGQIIVDVAKGIEPDTLLTMSQVIKDELSKKNKAELVNIVALSGPTHAEEVAKDMPTTIVSACENIESAQKVQTVFNNNCLRVYTNADIIGVELCGALKNIIAISTGISDGLGYGDNTKASIITRGMFEIKNLGLKMGCVDETFYGLAGIGDMIVTSTSVHSRNNRFGYLVGKGYDPKDAIKEVGMVVEGINALPAAMSLSEKYNVELPICYSVNQVINHNASPLDAVNRLMERRLKSEITVK